MELPSPLFYNEAAKKAFSPNLGRLSQAILSLLLWRGYTYVCSSDYYSYQPAANPLKHGHSLKLTYFAAAALLFFFFFFVSPKKRSFMANLTFHLVNFIALGGSLSYAIVLELDRQQSEVS